MRRARVLGQAHVVLQQVEVLRVIFKVGGEALGVEELRSQLADPGLAHRGSADCSRRILRTVPQPLYVLGAELLERLE